MTAPVNAQITSLRTEGSGRLYAAQPQTVTHASSMDAASAALMVRMRRAGHSPRRDGKGLRTSWTAAGYTCRRCARGWLVVKLEQRAGWYIDPISLCPSRAS
jgi:hypothetical protein